MIKNSCFFNCDLILKRKKINKIPNKIILKNLIKINVCFLKKNNKVYLNFKNNKTIIKKLINDKAVY